MSLLEGKKAVVTGGAQGLGAAITEHLAEEGCDVVVWDVNLAQALATSADVAGKTGRMVTGRAVDVTDADAVRAAVDEAVELMGRLDIMVCNAGILIAGDSIEFDAAKWRKVIDVDLTGYFLCAREAARVMVPNNSGSIIQINSKSGKKGSFKKQRLRRRQVRRHRRHPEPGL